MGCNAVLSPSERSAGAKTTKEAAKKTARQALQLELCKNLLTLALNFPEQPAQLDVHMEPSLLEPHTPAATPPAPPPAGKIGGPSICVMTRG